MPAPSRRTLHPLLLERVYWRNRLQQLNLAQPSVLLIPRPELSTNAVEVDEFRLRTSDYPAVVQQRIAGSSGHLSNRAAAELLTQLMHPGLSTVVLAHLSEKCNSEAEARAEVWPALMAEGFEGELHVATQDQPVGPFALLRLSREGVLPLF